MEFSDTRVEIFKALNQYRKKLKQPKKDAHNKFFNSGYVTLEGVINAVDEAIEGTGLSYLQEVVSESANQISVGTIITHESGEYIQFDRLVVNTTKTDVQAFGSAETYARRYTLSAAFGIASDIDDDGNEASKKQTNNQTQSSQASKKQELLISGKQLAELKQEANKITEITGINPDNFINKLCEIFTVKSIDSLPQNQVSRAKSQLIKWKQSYLEKESKIQEVQNSSNTNNETEKQTQLFDDRKINNTDTKQPINWGQK